MLFAETAVNYNWPNIMKTINEDPVGFYEMGGWSYLQPGQVYGTLFYSSRTLTQPPAPKVSTKKMTMRKISPKSMRKTKRRRKTPWSARTKVLQIGMSSKKRLWKVQYF